jgi:hypothetical protein
MKYGLPVFLKWDLNAEPPELMIEQIHGLLKDVLIYKPDFMCLP